MALKSEVSLTIFLHKILSNITWIFSTSSINLNTYSIKHLYISTYTRAIT